MAIIDQQGATIGRSQMGPVAVAAAATATVAAGGQQQQQQQQKKIVGSVENGVWSCNFMLNVATNWLQQPTNPPPPSFLCSPCGSISWPLWRVSSALFVVD